MSASGCLAEIYDSRMCSDAVVPKDHSTRLPSKPGLEVGAFLDVTVEQLKNGVGLFLLEPDNLAAELAIDEKSLLASDWMSSNERMDILNRLSLDYASSSSLPRILGLSHPRVENRESFDVGFEGW